MNDNDIFNRMLSRYQIHSKDDLSNAMHEVMQQVTLAGLYRGGFFDRAAFYGGTCLRIFYDMQRFSEDMDFSLLQVDNNFALENYLISNIANTTHSLLSYSIVKPTACCLKVIVE